MPVLFLIQFTVSVQINKNMHAPVNAQFTAIQTDVIILCMTPFHICVKTIVGSTALILVLQPLFGCFLTFTVFFDDTLGTTFHTGMNKYI